MHPCAPVLVLAMAISYLVSKYGHKSITSNALTNDFIYLYLLPIIVLAEGFNNRKKSLNYYKKEIIYFGVVAPILGFIISALVVFGIEKLFMDVFGIMKAYK